ncbi:MAG: helix-turn-helix transcriptional regulator [Microlunatus sp.]
MDLGTRLNVARRLSGLTASDVARLAEVAVSTVTRVEQGAWGDVSYSRVMRLLDAVDLKPDLTPLSRPDAISAFRFLVDDAPAPPTLDFWLERWRKLNLLDDNSQPLDAREVAWRASCSAPLQSRPGSVVLPRMDLYEVGHLLGRAGIEWANTGDSAANRLAECADETWPVLYVADIRAALAAIGAQMKLPGDPLSPSMTLIPFDGFSEAGRWTDADTGLVYAAPWQVVADCYAGADRMLQQADWILETWKGAA